MPKPTSTQFITRTAVMLALALVFQIFGGSIAAVVGLPSNFVVGPLVNLCLLVATAISGVWSGAFVGLMTPATASLTGHLPIPVQLVPIIVVGNLLLVAVFWLFDRGTAGSSSGAKLWTRIVGIVAGAVLKTAWLWAVTAGFAGLGWLPAKAAPVLVLAMSWPQGVTAAIGGVLALLVLVPLELAVRRTE